MLASQGVALTRRGTALAVVRGLAFVLLGLVAADQFDSWCDPIRAADTRQRSVESAPPGAQSNEDCSTGCVPDCLCCAGGLPAFTFFLDCVSEGLTLERVTPLHAHSAESVPTYRPPRSA